MENWDEFELPPTIEDAKSARAFVGWCIGELGLGYHPDTPFGDYVNDDSTRCFTDDQGQQLDALSARAFEYCDPYAIGLVELRRILRRRIR